VPKRTRNQPTQAAPVEPRLLDVRGAAVYLSTTIWNIRNLTWAGKLKPVPVGGARQLFDKADLDAFVEKAKARA
jgi:hypothetical protein